MLYSLICHTRVAIIPLVGEIKWIDWRLRISSKRFLRDRLPSRLSGYNSMCYARYKRCASNNAFSCFALFYEYF